ncbi:MAG: hypothetical protein JWR86_1537, partial [Enterovirga sp.]|nr:hypothetical protein [Enterovirga sp.]
RLSKPFFQEDLERAIARSVKTADEGRVLPFRAR